MTPLAIQERLRALGDAAIAEHARGFFKTGPGEYGEGDRFLGIRVPVLRKLVREYDELPLADVLHVLSSPYHEERLFALLLMVHRFERADGAGRKTLYEAYLDHTRYINNWDLVDSSAHQIVGGFLWDRSRRKLGTLSRSRDLWERRIAIIATYHFIKRDQFDDTLTIGERLLSDREDLIHKAVGWMLREVGKRDRAVEESFLSKHYRDMPRTMLRYAIERFEPDVRRAYLQGTR